MKNLRVKDFHLRGNYRNYNMLSYFLNDWKNPGAADLPKGYLPSEVEYRDEEDGKIKVIKVSFEETHYLSRNDREKALRYLHDIITAREGNAKAKAFLLKKAEAYYADKAAYCNRLNIIENRYIVPSVSANNYDEHFISQKGKNLLELVQEGYPVPDFCILTSNYFHLNDNERQEILNEAISNLEKMTGLKLGSSSQPLVFAMRCAMPMQIPGLMPTYLNIGVTIKSYIALKEIYGRQVAAKIYLNNLKTIYNLLYPGIDKQLKPVGMKEETGIQINRKVKFLYEKIKQKDDRLLWDPYYQVNFFVREAREFYQRNQDLLFTFIKEKQAHPSLILQKMVWTVRGGDSYPGVLYTHHSRTGLGIQVESLRSIFGEDIMTGTIAAEDDEYLKREEIKVKFPAIYHFYPLLTELEKKMESPATIEFGVESGRRSSLFAVLQLNMSELTGRATLLSAIDLYEKGFISRERVVKLVKPYHLRQIFSERIDDRSFKSLEFFTKGVSILPRSAVTAQAYFSANTAFAAKKRGEKVCFCKGNFVPTDTIVISEVDAILSINPIAIHVVTACLGYGIPALIDLQQYAVRLENNRLINASGKAIEEGDFITISSKNRAVFLGMAKYKPARFQKYLLGHRLELEEKEEQVFMRMARAYKAYQEIVNSIDRSKIVKIGDLAKIIRNDLKDNPGKAEELVNNWYDVHRDIYPEQILMSELGSHQEQHTIFNLLATERKISFFKDVIRLCRERNLKGFTAGSFMLGRFLCLPQSIAFWKAMEPAEIAFIMNEFIYFEKYIMVLNEVGERNLNTARKKILTDGLGNITLNPASIELFITLKLAGKDREGIINNLPEDNIEETRHLAELLMTKPFSYFYDYEAAWSVGRLKELCEKDGIQMPAKDDK